MNISPARKIAFDIIRRVESEGAYASDALHIALDSQIKSSDAALATELTMGVLRWRGLLDFLLERHTKKPMARLDQPVALALRIGLYQLRFLQKIPPHAALHESVDLVKRARKLSAAPFVNAVLRKASQEIDKPAESFLPQALPVPERLALLYSHPLWMVHRWLSRFGEARTIALMQANNSPPLLSCSFTDPAHRESVSTELAGDGLSITGGRLLRNAFSVRGGSPAHTSAFREGRISIQDEASQAVPLLLATQPGDRVFDVCAAPGGKTAILAKASLPNGLLIASDLHIHRLLALRDQMRRLGTTGVHLLAADAERALPFRAPFHRVLVDVPCSGTGTLARHPEIRWRLQPSQFGEYHAMQAAILRNALAQLAPTGRLVYSTCSLEPEENEGVIEETLRGPGGRTAMRVERTEAMQSLAPWLAPTVSLESVFDVEGQFRTFPDRHGTDGFFAAALQFRHS